MIKFKINTIAFDDVKILDNTSIFFENGLNIIEGPSGVGKTSLFNYINGFIKNDGDVFINDEKITQNSWNEILNNCASYIFQDFRLFERLTIKENITFFADTKGIKYSEEDVKTICSKFNLPENLEMLVETLSLGQKQRVALARSLLVKPKILFCDEPTANLDINNTEIIFDYLEEISQDIIVILITHEQHSFSCPCNLWSFELHKLKLKKQELNKTNFTIKPQKPHINYKDIFKTMFFKQQRKIYFSFIVFFLSILFLAFWALQPFIYTYINKISPYYSNLEYVTLSKETPPTTNVEYQKIDKETDSIVFSDEEIKNIVEYNNELTDIQLSSLYFPIPKPFGDKTTAIVSDKTSSEETEKVMNEIQQTREKYDINQYTNLFSNYQFFNCFDNTVDVIYGSNHVSKDSNEIIIPIYLAETLTSEPETLLNTEITFKLDDGYSIDDYTFEIVGISRTIDCLYIYDLNSFIYANPQHDFYTPIELIIEESPNVEQDVKNMSGEEIIANDGFGISYIILYIPTPLLSDFGTYLDKNLVSTTYYQNYQYSYIKAQQKYIAKSFVFIIIILLISVLFSKVMLKFKFINDELFTLQKDIYKYMHYDKTTIKSIISWQNTYLIKKSWIIAASTFLVVILCLTLFFTFIHYQKYDLDQMRAFLFNSVLPTLINLVCTLVISLLMAIVILKSINKENFKEID